MTVLHTWACGTCALQQRRRAELVTFTLQVLEPFSSSCRVCCFDPSCDCSLGFSVLRVCVLQHLITQSL